MGVCASVFFYYYYYCLTQMYHTADCVGSLSSFVYVDYALSFMHSANHHSSHTCNHHACTFAPTLPTSNFGLTATLASYVQHCDPLPGGLGAGHGPAAHHPAPCGGDLARHGGVPPH